jgi:hypothetical protein
MLGGGEAGKLSEIEVLKVRRYDGDCGKQDIKARGTKLK